MKSKKFNIKGMSCASCQANITRHVESLNGIKNVKVNLLTNQMSIQYDETIITPQDVIETVVHIGYGASVIDDEECKKSNDFRSEWNSRQQNTKTSQDEMKYRLFISLFFLIPLMYISMGGMWSLPMPKFFLGTENSLILALTQLIITIPIIFVNRHFFLSGFTALLNGVPNMDSLVSIGSSASVIYGVFATYMMAYGFSRGDTALINKYSHALYFESAAMILTLVTLGKFLEVLSKRKTSDALGKLIDLSPKTAVVIKKGVEEVIPVEKIKVDDIIVIKPGDSVPVDGVIVEGKGYVDQASITGESVPVRKGVGDFVISATINKNGSFKFRASRVGDDTTLAQIIKLVDEAGNSKMSIARVVDRVSGVFVPIVIGIAIITVIAWLLVGQSFEFSFSCAIGVLVISCPCALGLATPVAIMVGTGKAAEFGILIKSAESLELMCLADTIVLDKTGTITSGTPSVTDIIPISKNTTITEILSKTAAIESGSSHHIASAIIKKAKLDKVKIPNATDFETVPGRGVRAVVDNQVLTVGNISFIKDKNISLDSKVIELVNNLSTEGKTPITLSNDDKVMGIIAVADTIRESSYDAINSFNDMNLHTVMLTGDNKVAAQAIKKKLNISYIVSDVLPTEKEAYIKELQDSGKKVIMVGDGINDAPSLVRADVGIAIGAGTDIAIDSADVILMNNSLGDVLRAISLSKSVVKNIRMNLFWAFIYNILGIPIAAGVLFPVLGWVLDPMIGAAAMSLSSVSVVLNALRLRFLK